MTRGRFSSGAGALALCAGIANAAPIVGSISFSDGFGAFPLPPPPTTEIVSAQVSFVVNPIVNVYTPVSGTGAFAATASARAADFSIVNLPSAFFSTDTGFTFTLTGASIVDMDLLDCNGQGFCTDGVLLEVAGTVTGPGFDPTEFSGAWSANGSCAGVDTQCQSNVTASWSAALSATGRLALVRDPTGLAEPTGLALFGAALAGLAFARGGGGKRGFMSFPVIGELRTTCRLRS